MSKSRTPPPIRRSWRGRAWHRLATVALVGLSVTACNSGGTTGNGNSEPIKIGVAVPLTGGFAAGGPSQQHGAELAVEQYNAAGGYQGRKVELVVKDDQTDPQTGIAVMQDLVHSQGVVAVIGSGASPSATTEATVAQKAGVAYIACASVDTLTSPPKEGGKNFVFRSAFSARAQVQTMLNYAKSRPNLKLGVLFEATGFGIPAEKSTRDEAAALGLTIVASESVPADTSRLEPQLQRLRDKGVDILIVWQIPAGLVNLGKSLQTLGWKPDVLTSYAATNPGFLKTSGAVAEGFILPNAYLPEVSAEAKDFETKFEAKFGPDPWPVFSALYYDATRLVLGALDKAGPDRAKIRDALEGTSGFKAVTQMPAAPFSATNHDALLPSHLFLTRIRDSKLVRVES